MSSPSIVPNSSEAQPAEDKPSQGAELQGSDPPDSEMITITQTYTFAGKTLTKKEAVPRNSDKAKMHLAQKVDDPPSAVAIASVEKRGPEGQLLYRPLRRVSRWDPNPEGIVNNLPTRRDGSHSMDAKSKGLRVVDKSKLGWHGTPTGAAGKATKVANTKAPRLNVVEKSKLDWAEHVDQAGDRDELDAAAKSKGDYLERRRFLERVEGKKDEEYMKGKKE